MGSAYGKVGKLPTIRRLPSYLYLLRPLRDAGCAYVSATYLAAHLQLDPVQVRKDLAVTGIAGRPRRGFEVATLIDGIEQYLGWNNTTEAFLVGVGSLGTALLGYQGFPQHGLNIVAAFDDDPVKIHREVRGKLVLPMEKLAVMAERLRVSIGIIAVPTDAAQAVADQLVAARMQGIWNFTTTTLQVPAGVMVQNEDLSVGLAVLSKKLATVRQAALDEATGA